MDTFTSLAEKTIKRFSKSIDALKKALDLDALPENAKRDSVLLRFELSAELTIKTLKRVLEEKGLVLILPKEIIRSSVSAKILGERSANVLLEIVDDRNRMVHDYNEKFSQDLYKRIEKKYFKVLLELRRNLERVD